MTALVLGLDQGTSSTRCVVLDADLCERGSSSVAVASSFPRSGLVEQDPETIAESAIASGSCSTRPGRGNDDASATDAEPRSERSASSTTQRVLDVPWSSPRTSSVMAAPSHRGAR